MNSHQKQILMKKFIQKPYPDKQEILQLVLSLDLSKETIRWWYSRKRQQFKDDEVFAIGEEFSRR